MLKKLLLTLLVAMLMLKLSTTIFHFSDDPTSGLLLRPTCSFVNLIVVEETSPFLCLIKNENGFPGEKFYLFITTYGWLILSVILIGLFARDEILQRTKEITSKYPPVLMIKMFLFAITTLGLWIFIAVSSTKSNHTGIPINLLHWPYVGWIFLFLYDLFSGSQKRVTLIMISLALLTIVGLQIVLSLNILVPYELWLEKGMPERFD